MGKFFITIISKKISIQQLHPTSLQFMKKLAYKFYQRQDKYLFYIKSQQFIQQFILPFLAQLYFIHNFFKLYSLLFLNKQIIIYLHYFLIIFYLISQVLSLNQQAKLLYKRKLNMSSPRNYQFMEEEYSQNMQSQANPLSPFGNSQILIDSEKFIQFQKITPEDIQTQINQLKNQFNLQQGALQQDEHFQQKIFQVLDPQQEPQSQMNNMKLVENKRDQPKASIYSKNYRQKNKQRFKQIQQENFFLKNKINDLQNRLRQTELELNSIKFNQTHPQSNIQQLTQQMLSKLSLISDFSIKGNQIIKQVGKISSNQKKQQKMHEFQIFYDEHGYGGRKKKEILSYYMNEFLQNVMRDRQKCYFLTCIKQKYLSGQLSPFQIQISQILMETQDQKRKKAQVHELVKPACWEVINSCKQIYKYYKKTIGIIEKIQQIIKRQSLKDIDQVKSQSRGATWFHLNQYRKQMRDLRAQWVNLITKQDQLQQIEYELRKNKSCRIKK